MDGEVVVVSWGPTLGHVLRSYGLRAGRQHLSCSYKRPARSTGKAQPSQTALRGKDLRSSEGRTLQHQLISNHGFRRSEEGHQG